MLKNLQSCLKIAAATLALGSLIQTLEAGSAADLHTRMRQGINYGNYFDGGGAASRTSTTIAAIPKSQFTTLKNAGFEHVRLSVCWGYRLNWPTENYYGTITAGNTVTVNDTFMAAVRQSVLNARDAGLIVILDTHHEDWFQQYWSDPATRNTTIKLSNGNYITATNANGGRPAERIFKDIWKDIWNNFKNDARFEDVVFEVLNEPRKTGSGIGTFSDADLNTLNNIVFGLSQDSYAVNMTGTKRVMMLAVNDANNVKSLKAVTLPTRAGMTAAQVRDQCMVTIHYYFPNSFTHYTDFSASGISYPKTKYWGNGANANDYPDMDSRFALMQNTTAANFTDPNMVGIKINLGEFGVVHTDGSNTASMQRWYTGVMSRSATRGLTTTVWCDSGDFGVFNHSSGTFTFTGDKAYRSVFYDYVNN